MLGIISVKKEKKNQNMMLCICAIGNLILCVSLKWLTQTTSDFNLININKNQQNAFKISEDKIYNLHVKLYSTNIAT